MSRKHMPLLAGGLVVLLLVAGLGYWLITAKGRYADEAGGLDLMQKKLNRLSSRTVFPSAKNVDTLGQQLSIYEEYLNGLFTAMREGQPKTGPIDRDRFRRMLEQTLRSLVQGAREKSITLPPDFAFGFQRYAAGELPAEENLGRLVDQLRSVEALCQVLYDSGVSGIDSVERTLFEETAQAEQPAEEDFRRSRNRGRAEPEPVAASTALVSDPDGLYTKETYILTYRAQDDANWKVLDRLARGAPFVVVTQVDITNTARPVVVTPKAAETEEAPPPTSTSGWMAPGARAPVRAGQEQTILPRDLRVLAGREQPLVRLQVDLYRFTEEETAEEGEVQP